MRDGRLELRLGPNRVGRDPENDFTIEHPTVSTHHCEFILSNDGVVLNDLDSTNGSFVNGQQVTNIWLETGPDGTALGGRGIEGGNDRNHGGHPEDRAGGARHQTAGPT